MSQKKAPGVKPGAVGMISDHIPTSPQPTSPHYWLHVRADGTEVRFNYEPDWVPTLCVFVDGKTEITHMLGSLVKVKPRGWGWIAAGRVGESTRWTRRARS